MDFFWRKKKREEKVVCLIGFYIINYILLLICL